MALGLRWKCGKCKEVFRFFKEEREMDEAIELSDHHLLGNSARLEGIVSLFQTWKIIIPNEID